MKTIMLYCSVALFFLCSAVNVQAVVVFSDNFENVTAVHWPDSTQYAQPVAQTGSWIAFQSFSAAGVPSPQFIQVSNNAVPGPAEDGSNFLSILREGAIDARAFAGWTQALDDTGIIVIEFDFYMRSGLDDLRGMTFGVQTPGTGTGLIRAVGDAFIYLDAVNSWRLRPAGGGGYEPVNFALDTWHRIRYDINIATQTYDITISGTTFEGYSFQNAAESLGQMVFACWPTAGSTYHLDNITVSGEVAGPDPLPEIVGRVFYDGFENVDAVQWPDPTQWANPVAEIGAWLSIISYDAAGVRITEGLQVSNNAVPGTAGDGSNFLSIHRAGANDSRAFAGWSEELDSTEERVIVEFDFYMPSGLGNDRGMTVNFKAGTVYSGVTGLVLGDAFLYNSAFGTGNSWRLRPAGGSTYVPVNFAVDAWYPVRYDIDIAAQTYSITIAGTTFGDYAFRSSSSSLGQMWFGCWQGGSNHFVDNVVVGVLRDVCVEPPRNDFTGDCMVDIDDFAIFLDYWLMAN